MQFNEEFILLSGTPFGDVQIRYYGIIIVAAMLVAASMAARLAQRTNRDPDHIWGALTWAIFPGIILARLWFVLFPTIGSIEAGRTTAWYFQNFFDLQNGAIAIWSGGLSIFGAVLGGFLGAWLYFSPYHNPISRVFHYIFLPLTAILEFIAWIFVAIYRLATGKEFQRYSVPKFESEFPAQGMNMAPWLDIAGVTLPLAQAIGRWANFINQELYGLPTNLPWGIPIDAEHRVGQYASTVEYPVTGQDATVFHPLFLYESLWNLIAFFVLLNLYNRNRDRFIPGDFFLLYLAQYSFVRFFLEFLRIEQALIPGTAINSSQVITAAVFFIALAVFFIRRAGSTRTSYEEPQTAEA